MRSAILLTPPMVTPNEQMSVSGIFMFSNFIVHNRRFELFDACNGHVEVGGVGRMMREPPINWRSG